MDIKTAIKIVQRRINHLNKRLEAGLEKNSEQALMFDAREKEALELLIEEASPPAMAEEAIEIKDLEIS